MYISARDGTFLEPATGPGDTAERDRPRSRRPSANGSYSQATSELIAALEYRIGLDGDLCALADTLEILAGVVRRKAARPQSGGAAEPEQWSGRPRSKQWF